MTDRPPVPPSQPGQPGQPGQSGQPGQPGAADPLGRVLRSVPVRDWVAAVVAAVGGWIAAYVVAGISLLLTVVSIAASSGSSGSTGSGSGGSDLGGASGAPDVQSLLSGVSVLLGSPAQLVALADFGRLHGSGSIPLLGTGSGSIGVVPVLVLAAQVVLAVVLTRRIRTRVVPVPQLVLTALLSGLVTVAVTTLTGLVLAIRFPNVPGASIDAVHAVGVGSVLGSFVVGTLAALLARPSLLARGGVHFGRALGTLRVAASQVGVVVVLLALVVLVLGLVAQQPWTSALPLLLGNVAVALTALGFFGGLGTSGLGSASSTASVFAGVGGWTWLVVLLVVVTAFVAGLALAVRRNDRVRTTLDWIVTPAAWFVLGLVLLVLGTGVVSYQVTGTTAVGGSGSVGVAPWTPVVFALWGAAIEVVARFVAPTLVPRLAGGVVLLTARLVGTDPVPTGAASGTGTPSWTQPVSDPPAGSPAGGTPDQHRASTDGPDPAWAGTPAADGTTAQTAAAQPGGAFIGQGASAPAPMSPRARKVLVRSLIAGGAVVVVVIAGAVTAGVLRTSVWGPGATARSYVQAIASGDARTAARLSEVTGDASMLDATVLKSATSRPRDVQVGRVTTSGDSAYAAVTFRQGGATRSGRLVLERTGTSFLVKDEWRVTEPLATRVSITATEVLEGAPVTIGGKKVGVIENNTFQSLAYPGTYKVSVGGTKYFTGGTETLRVGSSSAPYVDFTAKPTKRLETDAQQYVADLVTRCAAKTEVTYSDGCPWYGPYDADGSVRYQVTTKPTVEVSASGGGTVEVKSTSDGRIRSSYKDYFGDQKQSDDSFDVDMYLKVEDGKLVSAY